MTQNDIKLWHAQRLCRSEMQATLSRDLHLKTGIVPECFKLSNRRDTNEGYVTGAIFADLSKTFDTSRSDHCYGITGKPNELFINYPFGRKQSVCFGCETSQLEAVTCGY